MKRNHALPRILCVAAVLSLGGARAAEVAFENDLATMKIDEKGCISSLVAKADGVELVDGIRSFCWAGDAKSAYPVRMEPRGNNLYAWLFAEGEVVVRITSFGPGWTFEIVSCSVPSADNLHFGHVRVKCRKYIGRIANMNSDDDHCVCLRGYRAKCRMFAHGELRLNVKREHGFAGTRGGLAVTRRDDMRAALRAMTVEADVFTSVNGGSNSLGSERNRGSYCMSDVGADCVEDWVDIALRGGFDTIHQYSWFETSGSYPYSKKCLPDGEADFKRVCDAIHDAGLHVGIHTFSYNISPNDALLAPVCKGPLMAWCTVTLARDLKPGDTEMFVVEPVDPEKFHTFHSYSSRGNTLQFGSEFIQYAKVDSARRALGGLVRGAWKTRAGGLIPAGTKLNYVRQMYNAFFADPSSDFGEEVGKNIARICKLGKVDQIYLDGAEAIRDDRDYANDRLRERIVQRLDPGLLIEGSNGDAFTWWYLSRFGAWDRPRWGMKRMHDDHLHDVERARRENFLESQMGWWGPEIGNDRQPAQKIDDMEYFAARNAAVDTSMSIQGLFANAPCPHQFTVVQLVTLNGWYERFRMARAFTDAAMAKMRRTRQETRLRQNDAGVWQLWSNDVYFHRADPGSVSEKWSWNIATSPVRSALRVEALYAADETSSNRVTLVENGTVTTAEPEVKAKWPKQPYKNCKGCYALAVDIQGDGSGADVWVILESSPLYGWGKNYHRVKLDFTGWRHFTFSMRESDVNEAYDQTWEGENKIHPMVACAQPLNTEHLLSAKVVLNGVPAGREACAAFRNLVALPSVKKRVVRSGVRINGQFVPVPFEMSSGEYAELEDGVWNLYSEGGQRIRQAAGVLPPLAAGENAVAYAGETKDGAGARAEVTYFAIHSPVNAVREAKDRDASMQKALAYEAVMPSQYRPAVGMTSLEKIRVRAGEKATIETTIFGPVDTPTFRYGGEAWKFPVKIARNQRLYCKNGRDWRLVDAKRKQLASGTLAKPLPTLSGGTHIITFDSADDKKADCRVDLVKHYVAVGET